MGRSLARRVLSGGALSAAALALNSLLVLGINALFARLMTPQDLGTYLLLVSLAVTLSVPPQCGLQRVVVRRIAQGAVAQEWESVADTVSGALMLAVLASAATGMLVAAIPADWYGRAFPSSNVQVLAHCVPALLALTAVRNVVAESFRGLHLVGWASFHSRLSYNLGIALMAGGALVLWRGLDLDLAANMASLVAGFSLVLATVHLLVTVRRRCGTLRVRWQPVLLQGGGSITLVTSLAMVSQEAHLWILSSMADAEEAAIFGVVNRTAMLMTLPLLVMNGVVPQFIAELIRQGDVSRRNILVQLATLVGFAVAATMALVFWAAGRQVLQITFGSPFGAGYVALAVAAAGQVALGATAAMTQLMVMSQHERPLAVMTVTTAFIGLGVTTTAASHLGNVGGALGFTVGATAQGVCVWRYCRSRLELEFPLGPGEMRSGLRALASVRKRRTP